VKNKVMPIVEAIKSRKAPYPLTISQNVYEPMTFEQAKAKAFEIAKEISPILYERLMELESKGNIHGGRTSEDAQVRSLEGYIASYPDNSRDERKKLEQVKKKIAAGKTERISSGYSLYHDEIDVDTKGNMFDVLSIIHEATHAAARGRHHPYNAFIEAPSITAELVASKILEKQGYEFSRERWRINRIYEKDPDIWESIPRYDLGIVVAMCLAADIKTQDDLDRVIKTFGQDMKSVSDEEIFASLGITKAKILENVNKHLDGTIKVGRGQKKDEIEPV